MKINKQLLFITMFLSLSLGLEAAQSSDVISTVLPGFDNTYYWTNNGGKNSPINDVAAAYPVGNVDQHFINFAVPYGEPRPIQIVSVGDHTQIWATGIFVGISAYLTANPDLVSIDQSNVPDALTKIFSHYQNFGHNEGSKLVVTYNDVTTIVQSALGQSGIVTVGNSNGSTGVSGSNLYLGADPAVGIPKVLVLFDANGKQISSTAEGQSVSIPTTFTTALFGPASSIPVTIAITPAIAVKTKNLTSPPPAGGSSSTSTKNAQLGSVKFTNNTGDTITITQLLNCTDSSFPSNGLVLQSGSSQTLNNISCTDNFKFVWTTMPWVNRQLLIHFQLKVHITRLWQEII